MEQETQEITVAEAARRLGISRNSVHVALREGKLRGTKHGPGMGVWGVDPRSVEEYIVIGHRPKKE